MSKFIEIDSINEFALPNKKKKHLVIMTPFYGGVCHVNYITCLINTKTLLESEDIIVSIEFCKNDSLVTRARNNLIGKSMNDLSISHFIFIDSDITWNPNDILKLINSDKDIIGGVYPLKNYFWSDVNSELLSSINSIKNIDIIEKKKMSQEDILRSKIVKYNLNYISSIAEIENNIMEVRHVATGFMMFKRETIIQMQKKYPETKYTDDIGFISNDKSDFTYALFDCGILDGHYLSEDWLFCERWRNIGGKIFVDVSIDLTHTGSEDYKGSLLTSLC